MIGRSDGFEMTFDPGGSHRSNATSLYTQFSPLGQAGRRPTRDGGLTLAETYEEPEGRHIEIIYTRLVGRSLSAASEPVIDLRVGA
jgi:hypothetical protein